MTGNDLGHKLDQAAESTIARLFARVVTPILLAIIGYFVTGQLGALKEATSKITLLSYKIDTIQGEVSDATRRFYTENEASKDQAVQAIKDHSQDTLLERLQNESDENSKRIQRMEIRIGGPNARSVH